MFTLCMPIKGGLQPSRRRSLFTLASYMFIFSARAGNFPELLRIIKASLMDSTVSFFPSTLLIPISCPCHSASFLKLICIAYCLFAFLNFNSVCVVNPQVDPFLELVDDVRLQAVNIKSEKIIYGSQEDDVAAMTSLSAVELDDKHLKETVISHFLTKFSKLPEVIWIHFPFCLYSRLGYMGVSWEYLIDYCISDFHLF